MSDQRGKLLSFGPFCCEHLIDATSALAEELFRRVPTLHLLATSREAMRVEGEHVYELCALACPSEHGSISAHDTLKYPSVQLLVDRARAVRSDFELTDADASTAARICRRLDGVPLAIELAACGLDIFGMGKTASAGTTGIRAPVRIACWIGSRANLDRAWRGAARP